MPVDNSPTKSEQRAANDWAYHDTSTPIASGAGYATISGEETAATIPNEYRSAWNAMLAESLLAIDTEYARIRETAQHNHMELMALLNDVVRARSEVPEKPLRDAETMSSEEPINMDGLMVGSIGGNVRPRLHAASEHLDWLLDEQEDLFAEESFEYEAVQSEMERIQQENELAKHELEEMLRALEELAKKRCANVGTQQVDSNNLAEDGKDPGESRLLSESTHEAENRKRAREEESDPIRRRIGKLVAAEHVSAVNVEKKQKAEQWRSMFEAPVDEMCEACPKEVSELSEKSLDEQRENSEIPGIHQERILTHQQRSGRPPPKPPPLHINATKSRNAAPSNRSGKTCARETRSKNEKKDGIENRLAMAKDFPERTAHLIRLPG